MGEVIVVSLIVFFSPVIILGVIGFWANVLDRIDSWEQGRPDHVAFMAEHEKIRMDRSDPRSELYRRTG